MNPLEKRRLYLNQKKKNQSSDWSERKAPTSVNAVSITNSQLSAKFYNIDRKKALKTIKCTTKRGIRTCLRPSLSRRYPKNSVWCVTTVHSKSGVVYKRANKYGQAYFTQYGWSWCHPIKLKSEAHEYFSMLSKLYGVPPKIVVYNSKEQSLGNFASKCRESNCHLVNTDPYSPWMMAVKGCIKHLKQVLPRKMLKSASPKRLWDHCIELEALILSNNALTIYGL